MPGSFRPGPDNPRSDEDPDPCFLCGQPADYPGVWSYLRVMRPMPLCRACLEKVPTWAEEVTQLAEVG